MTSNPVFEARGVEKIFPGVKALGGVSLSLLPGSIHALLGENGAGKSTLIKVITGVHRPTSGEILLDGNRVHFANTREALAAGIGVVHQERNLIPRFSVAENIHLEQLVGRPLRPIDYAELNRQARQWLDEIELDVDPTRPVSELSVAQTQLVEIAKALSLRSRVLLLDEPTASLTPSESQTLFSILRRLRDSGVSLVFVSHKLEEVLEICDRVTVLRDGRNACESQSMQGMNRQDLVRFMIGRNEQAGGWRKRDVTARPVSMALQDVATAAGHRNISFSVRQGEILGLYGLVGAGRTELAKAIMGRIRVTGGQVLIDGQAARINSVADAIHRYGLGYVSEDRKSDGLVLSHSVLANAGIVVWRKLAGRFGRLSDAAVRKAVLPFLEQLEVKTPSLAQVVANLSGGNQQKISVAKWLAAGVKILIIDEPSVGIDIKTKAYLHQLIRELADRGTAVVLITSDMPEMISLADRIAVLDNYLIQGEVENDGVYDRMSQAIMNLIHHEAGHAAVPA
ncbi:sugar ABC transporter ATP-binding protein [Acidisoma cellulosilytica]|uniref:Sugar ABC transporter ATP-binding protein n=1 Tax=Acidisoma cellulosilyticum TaxID=2802395 RepID=A0A963Z3J3_9PROT|nr:sugar ABC transporter ATP-binding protein [Acidisoma cellulosilyticum]MCB8881315.1 sugar ABC transporter ATP-binding protein [Acidisoma cellulosilyticum]